MNCKYCGCTEGRACLVRVTGPPEIGEQLEPCQWLDDEGTVCSGCVSKLSEEELLDLGAAELPLVSDLDVPLMLGGLQALLLAAVLDVALKHPELPRHRAAHQFATALRRTIGDVFADPTFCCTAELLRRGALPPLEEPPPEPARSTLILPGV